MLRPTRFWKAFVHSVGVFAIIALAAPQLAGAVCRWQVTQLPGNYAGPIVAFAANDVWFVNDLLLHWNGVQWIEGVLPPPPPNTVVFYNSISGTSDSDLWLAGEARRSGLTFPTSEHFDGTSWREVPVPYNTSKACSENKLLWIKSFAANNVWAFEGDCNAKYLVAVHWDGSRWADVSEFYANDFYFWGAGNGDSFVSASSDHDFWIVGTEFVHFDGQRWSTNTPKYMRGFISGVYADSPTDAWVVGIRTKHSEIYRTYTYHWDGVKWTEIPSPNEGGHNNQIPNVLDSVSGTGPNDVWAVGANYRTGAGMALHWDGQKWSDASPDRGLPQELLTVVAVAPNFVLAIGYGPYAASNCR